MQFQMNQDMIAQIAAEIEAARLMVYKAAWQKDQGQLGNTLEVAHAKYLAGEIAAKAAQNGHEDHGRLRILHRIPGGQILPGCTPLLDGGRFRQYLQDGSSPWINWASEKQTDNIIAEHYIRRKKMRPYFEKMTPSANRLQTSKRKRPKENVAEIKEVEQQVAEALMP